MKTKDQYIYGTFSRDQFNSEGVRMLTVSLPHIQIVSLNNITVENSIFRSYSSVDDANKQQVQFDTPAVCNFPADNLERTMAFRNNYITSDAQIKDPGLQYFIICAQKSDLGKRKQICIFENILAENVKSFISFMAITSGNLNLTLTNITQRNVSQGPFQTFQLQLQGGATSTIQLRDIAFINCVTQSRIVILFLFYQHIRVDNLKMINNTRNCNEKEWTMFHKRGYQSNNWNLSIQQFVLFREQYLFKLNEDVQVGSYIIRFDEYSEGSNPELNSTFKNITMKNCQTNFLLFGGFKDNGITDLNKLYVMFMINLNIVNNIISREQAIIKIDYFISTDNSQVIISNSTFKNNSFTSGGDLIKATQNSRNPMIIENTYFTENFQGKIQIQAGDVRMTNLPLQVQINNCNVTNNIPLIVSFIKINTNSRLVINDSVFHKTLSLSRGSVLIADYQKTWTMTEQVIISLYKMPQFFTDAMEIKDDLKYQIMLRPFDGLIKFDSVNLTLESTSIQAFLVQQSTLILFNTNFTNCQSKDSGGAILITKLCQQNMTDDVYIGNMALVEGGAFSYNKYRPRMVGVNFSQDNYAPYGPQFSGYPYGVKIISYERNSIASGQQYTGEIVVALVDADQNIITNDGQSCQICGVGFYSLQQQSNQCYECPSHSECLGEDKINVKKGYWRSGFYSTNIIECLIEEACIGGFITTNKSSNDLCNLGYGGNLCHSCILQGDQQFTRIGKHECGLCPSKAMNLLYILGIFIGLVVALLILLWINLRSKNESETSIAIRILMNYFHILTSAASFNLNWPAYLEKFLGIYSAVGQSAETFISFDCFLQDTGFTEPGGSTYYFKVIVIILLPFVLGMIFLIFFFVKKLLQKTSVQNFQRQVIVSFIFLLFSIHPTITRMTSSLYFCMELDKNEQWLQTDLEIRCWSGSHLKWSLGIGLPAIILWVVGLPVMGFLYLRRNQQQLDDPIFFGKYKMIYQGLKRKYFYWEFANILRKVLLISINVFLNLYPNIFKALLSLLTMSIFMKIQQNIQPYKNPVINQLAHREIMTSISTFFGALFFHFVGTVYSNR
eukprot:403370990